jgi:outer membrane receptor protein involved in Fe transport
MRALRSSLLLAAPACLCATQAVAQSASSDEGLVEITVTATRREESLSKVPISVSAFSQEQMDSRGLKQIDDVVRYTPGLTLTRLSNGSNNIAIRGISSGAGAGTTGVYIDDTPIQVRNLAYSSGTIFPALFDLERVEVLRGPQGTLFGAGSEGGTVRFIQTSPGLKDYSAYARAELSTTRGGDPSYEAGGAFGGPIIEDKLGFRVSAFYRRDGGYIDGITGTPVVLDPTGDAGPASLTFADRKVVRENTNSVTTIGLRGALKFALTDALTVTPSITYQKTEHPDGYDTFWPGATTGKSGYARPVFDAGNPATNPLISPLAGPNRDDGTDDFTLPALLVNWNLGPVQLVSNTSYFDRSFDQWFDFTQYYSWFYGVADYARAGDKASSRYQNTQGNFVQEVRLQSNDDTARFTWVAGAFYSDSRQRGKQNIGVNFLANAPFVGAFFLPFGGETDGPPFGPGHSAFENYFGVPPEAGSSLWRIDFRARDKQLAGFAQTDLKVTEKLKLIAGVRISRNELQFNADYSGPENNQNAPIGLPAPLPIDPLYSTAALSSSEKSVTPKVGVSYQMDGNNLFYATAAKGFRPAGASQRVPITCGPDLIDLGYVDANGAPSQPLKYSSDTVWSYELGTKNKLFENRLLLDASVYYIKWKNIQTSLFLQNCAESFTNNIAQADSQGFDVGLQINPVGSLSVTGSVGYNKSAFAADGRSPGGVLIVRKDGVIPGSPAPWVYSVSTQYDFHVLDKQKLYVRADFTHSSAERRVGQTDPNNPNFNPDLAPIAAYSTLNLRVGTQFAAAEVALFVNNVTGEDPDLAALNNSPLSGFKRYLWTDSTLRPRTFGLFASYRY